MPTMFPPTLFGQDQIPPGERQVFNSFASDDSIPGWSIIFRQEMAKRNTPEVEIDFVVIAPPLGILVLEIKSHKYVRRSNGAWYFGKSDTPEQANPFRKLNDRRHSLYRWLSSQSSNLQNVPISRLLLFPNAVLSKTSRESPDWLEFEFADAQDLENQDSLVSRICQLALQSDADNSRAQSVKNLSIEQARTITRVLVPDLVGIETSGVRRLHRNRELHALTEQQHDVLRAVRKNPRIAVDGYAGTGKTTLAIQTARELADEGLRVGLFCFNHLLGLHLSNVTAMDNLKWVGTIDSFARDILSKRNIAHKSKDHENRTEAALSLIDGAQHVFDAIVIDEAQDVFFRANEDDSWKDLLDAALANGLKGGRYHAFGDFQYQSLFGPESSGVASSHWWEDLPGHPFVLELRVNCRNPRLIGRRAGAIIPLDPPYAKFLRAGTPSDLEFVVADTDDIQVDTLASILSGLKDQGYSPSEIVIVSMTPSEHSCAVKLKKRSIARYGLSEYFLQDPEEVKVVRFDSIKRFKGLEAPIVIVTDVGDINPESRELLYCAMSRALDKCWVIMNSSTKKLLATDLD